MITQLKGTNGIIYLYEDRIVLSRKSFGGFAAFGLVGDRTIYYHSIQGVEVHGGILRIIPKGCDVRSYNILEVGKARKDNNCIFLKPKGAAEISEIINRKVNEICNAAPIKESDSTANQIREFKQLLDEGIITQEEFEKKKSELLK